MQFVCVDYLASVSSAAGQCQRSEAPACSGPGAAGSRDWPDSVPPNPRWILPEAHSAAPTSSSRSRPDSSCALLAVSASSSALHFGALRSALRIDLSRNAVLILILYELYEQMDEWIFHICACTCLVKLVMSGYEL